MDKRIMRGLSLSVIGGGLVWFGKGITDISTEEKVMGNAMIFSLILGAYTLILGLCSIYDFIVNPAKHDDY
ncbi:MAG: hypothetical protein ABIG39_07285 [Candidatus Micrarchaeota archaeon]